MLCITPSRCTTGTSWFVVSTVNRYVLLVLVTALLDSEGAPLDRVNGLLSALRKHLLAIILATPYPVVKQVIEGLLLLVSTLISQHAV